MNFMKTILICMILCLWQATSLSSMAQKPVKVHGKATLVVSDNDDITPMEAKRECIKRAKNEAIKEAFGEVISSNTEMVDATDANGNELNSFVQNTSMSARAEWVEDIKEPAVTLDVQDGRIVYTAEVWGWAREIPLARIDFTWKVLCGGKDDCHESNKFANRQRIFVKFRTPVDGYVALYLLDSTKKEASCLLPYKSNRRGQHRVQAGRDYVFFDSECDPMAICYRLTTDEPVEMDQIVLMFSPNPFTKCNEITGDRKHPNSLSIEDFENWLRKQRDRDRDLVVDRTKWLTITGNKG